MGRSLRVKQEYIERVRQALQRHGYTSQQALATDVGCGLSTIKNFLKGIPIDRLNFEEICRRLGLDWQLISEIPHKEDVNKNLEISPFITGNPIPHPRYFYGRQQEIKHIFDILKRYPLQNTVIIGQKRIGKTSLLHYIRNITKTSLMELRPGQKSDWLANSQQYKWVFVDFQDKRFANLEYFLYYLLEGLKLPSRKPCSLEYFIDTVSRHLNTPSVILMDEMGVALHQYRELKDDLWNSFRLLSANQTRGKLAFILAAHERPQKLTKQTGHSSPFFNVFGHTTILEPFTETESRELIASSPIPFSEENIQWIIETSQGLPYLLQILCQIRLFSLEEGETTDVWKIEAIRQIQPYL